MSEETIQLLAYIKQTDREIDGMLKDRELVRKKLIEIEPGLDLFIKEMVLAPKEDTIELGGKDGKVK